jgi:hypothetical protein
MACAPKGLAHLCEEPAFGNFQNLETETLVTGTDLLVTGDVETVALAEKVLAHD